MPHNSLGLKSYLHATSPIRRYSDLLVHYQLNRHLNSKPLITKDIIIDVIYEINNLSRDNIMRYREDQKLLFYKWFENNPFNEYQVILLSWINKYKNICILYFINYNFSSICNLKSKNRIDYGDKLCVKYISNKYNGIIYFQHN